MACSLRMLTILPQSNKLWGQKRLVVVALVAVVLASCSPMHKSHGFIPHKDVVAKIRAGVHDRDSVTSLFGPPTTVANFNGEIWIYIKRESEQIAFLPEKLVEQSVLAVRFDGNGIVTGIEQLAAEDGKVIELVERKTITRGQKLELIEQLIGNIGRFSNRSGN